MAADALGQRAGPGDPGDRQGGVPQRAHRRAVRAAVRGHDAEAELSETAAGDLTLATLGELAAPSLFSSIRCVVVRSLEDLPEARSTACSSTPPPRPRTSRWCWCTAAASEARGADQAAQAAGGDRAEVGGAQGLGDAPASSTPRSARYGGRIDKEAAQALVSAVGTDLRALAAAADQLTHDADGKPITEEVVKRYFGGKAEGKSFVIADAALPRTPSVRPGGAALGDGDRVSPSTLVTSAFAGSARGLARYRRAAQNVREADLAREVGVPPGSCKDIKAQAQGWTDAGLRPRDPRDRPGRRGHQGRGQRRDLHPGATGPHDRRAARPSERSRNENDPPVSHGRVGREACVLRERRPSWRSPTCGWRPGSCG